MYESRALPQLHDRALCGGLCLGPVENKYNHDIYSIEEAACNVYREITRRFIMDVDEGEVPAFYFS